ncbi:hypothetical protein BJF78_33545 [Pseudonocardia sp. CNS-139]|nr:hypothetical protein BJF78_33545 [Pseudonocardia sp. CNS-139]
MPNASTTLSSTATATATRRRTSHRRTRVPRWRRLNRSSSCRPAYAVRKPVSDAPATTFTQSQNDSGGFGVIATSTMPSTASPNPAARHSGLGRSPDGPSPSVT